MGLFNSERITIDSHQRWMIDAKGCVTLKSDANLHLTVTPRKSKRETEQKASVAPKKESGSKEKQDQIFNFILMAPASEVGPKTRSCTFDSI